MPTDPTADDGATLPPPRDHDTATMAPGAPHADVPARPEVPGYVVDGELGRGGMGVVYRARQVALNRPVALKMILSGEYADAKDLVRFLAEAEAVAAVDHPHVVRVYEFGRHAGRPFFAMEFLDGGSLSDRIQASGERKLAVDESSHLVEKLARGIQAAHDLGIVHRDLKPQNVLFDAAGEPKITDFGLAKRGGHDLTGTGAIMGTPAYMSPEQAAGKTKFVGPPADVYALGVILFECLTGRVPFAADDTVSLIMKVATEDAPPVRKYAPAVPRDLDLICLKCLTKDPAGRYPRAAALADDLARFRAGDPVSVRAPTRRERAAKFVRKNRGVVVAAVLIAAALLTGTAASVYFALEATAAAGRATADAERARTHERAAETSAQKATAAEAEQRTLAARQQQLAGQLLLGSARAALRDGDVFAALPWLAQAGQADPAAAAEAATRAAAYLAAAPRLVLFGRHDLPVAHLAAAEDGTLLATGAADGTVRVWDAAAGAAVGTPAKHPAGPIIAVAVSPDGTEVAAAGGVFLSAGSVARFDAKTGTVVGKPLQIPGTPLFVGYTADGARLVTGEILYAGGLMGALASPKPRYVARVWDRNTGKEIGMAEADPWGEPNQASFARLLAPAGGHLVTMKAEEVRVIDVATNKTVGEPLKPNGKLTYVGVTQDGRHVIAVGNKMEALVRPLAGGATTTVPLNYYYAPIAAAVAPGGELVVAYYDGHLRRYAVPGAKPLENAAGPCGEMNWSPQFTRDAAHVAAVGRGGAARVWKVADRTPAGPPLPGASSGTAVLALGRQLAAAGADGTVRVWDLSPAERAAFITELNFYPDAIAARPDGQFAVAGGGGVWLERPQTLMPNGTHKHPALNPAARTHVLTPDGARMFVGTSNGFAGYADVRGGAKPVTWKLDKPLVIGLFASADGQFVGITAADTRQAPQAFLGSTTFFDVAAGTPVFPPLRGDIFGIGVVTAYAFHPGADLLAVGRGALRDGGIHGQFQFHRFRTGAAVGDPIKFPPGVGLLAAGFTPDGTHLVTISGRFPTGGGTVECWDVAARARTRPAIPMGKPMSKLDFAPAGTVAVADGAKVLLVDPTGRAAVVELVHKKPVQAAKFQRAGTVLMTAADDELHLWDPATGEAIRPPIAAGMYPSDVALTADYALACGQSGGKYYAGGWKLTGPGRPFGVADALTRLVTGTHLGPTGVRPADPAALAADWEVVRRLAPDATRPAPADVVGWHDARGSQCLWQGDMRAAATHFALMAPASPENPWLQFVAGVAAQRAGDAALTRRATTALLGYPPTPAVVTWAVEVGLTNAALLPADERAKVIVAIAAVGGKGTVHYAMAASLAKFRAGDTADADTLLDRAALAPADDMTKARIAAQRALVFKAQGKAKDAKAQADAAAAFRAKTAASDPVSNLNWMGLGFLDALLAEAAKP